VTQEEYREKGGDATYAGMDEAPGGVSRPVVRLKFWRSPARAAKERSLYVAEMADHQFLERALLEASEQERRNIGKDLHDHLCQHLLGAAFAATAIAADLEREGSPQSGRVHDLARIIQEAVTQVRDVSRGLYPVELDSAGLMSALHELSTRISPTLRCDFHCEPPVLLDDPEQALHAYRIAQQAVTTAFHQTGATKIDVRLSEQSGWISLEIRDNGSAEGELTAASQGAAARTLQYRALAVGGRLSLSFDPERGTLVKCDFKRSQ